MSFAAEVDDFVKGFKTGSEIRSRRSDRKYREEQTKNIHKLTPEEADTLPGDGGIGGGGGKVGTADAPQVKSGGPMDKADDVRWKEASPEQRALLNTIAGTESPGYNVVYGGGTFDGYGGHPGIDVPIASGPNKGKTSSAAGRYQFLGSTWNSIASKYHLTDFSPENQDKAAWYLATEDYGRRTGRDLNTDIKSKDPNVIAGIGKALSGTWTSLPSGIEQGQSSDRFVTSFNNFLGKAPATGGDTGTAAAPAAAPAAPKAAEGALPEPGQQTASAADEGFEKTSPEAGIEVAQVDLTPVGPPQVTSDFTFGEERPLFAASGGVIPEPTQHFADGGLPNPAGTPDKYNPSRAWTQGLPQAPASTFVPRRVGTPGPTAPSSSGAPATGGMSSSQQALANARANLASQRAAAAAAKAQPAPQQGGDWQTVMKNQQIAEQMRRGAQSRLGGSSGGGAGQQSAMGRLNQQSLMAYQQAQQAAMKQAKAAGQDPWLAGQMVDASKYQWGRRGFEEGGVIPEPEENFARGGKVKDRDEKFQELLRNERTVTSRDSGQDARDTAAKRLSRMEGRPVSSAYSPKNDKEYFQPAKPRKKGTPTGKPYDRPDKTKTSSTKGPSDPGEDRATRFRPSEYERPIEEDRATRFKKSEIDDLNEDRATRFRAPQAGLSRNPYETDRGVAPGVLPEMPERLEGLPAELQPKAVVAMPDARGPMRKGDRVITPGITALTPPPGDREIKPGISAITEDPRYKTGPTIEGGVQGAIRELGPMVAPYLTLDPETGAPKAFSEPTPERFGREEQGPPVPAPDVIYKNGTAIRINPDIPPPPEQGAWINGQFVPIQYASGGMIPEDEQDQPISPRAESAGYTTSAPRSAATRPAPAAAPEASPAEGAAAEPEPERMAATPKLLEDVRNAVGGGMRFLTRHFGMDGGGGAVPTPEGQQGQQDGMRRFASGEGAMTPDEINGIDDNVDPSRELAEGDRQMIRMAKTAQWYLQQGRKEEAESVAAGLLQYGAQRSSQLGSMAAVAYRKFQETGDKQHLQNAVKILEKSYEMIPDGGALDVEIAADGSGLVVTKINADGEEEQVPVRPEELPQIIQGMQDKSLYWQQMTRLADPSAARSKDEAKRSELEWNRRHDIERKEELSDKEAEREQKLADAKTEAEAAAAKEKEKREYELKTKLDEEERTQKRTEQNKLLDAALAKLKGNDKQVDYAKVSPALGELQAAIESEDQDAMNEKWSRLWDAMPEEGREDLMNKLGYPPSAGFKYVAAAAEEAPKQAKDGKWYVKKPNGKYAEVEPPAGS